MPFTFKLAKRLARLKRVVFPVLAMLASCEQPVRQATGPDPSNTPVNVLVSPDSVALDPGQTQQFQAHGRTAAGDTVPVTVNCVSGAPFSSGAARWATICPALAVA